VLNMPWMTRQALCARPSGWELRQERHALETSIKMRKTFMMMVGDMAKNVDYNAWAVTRAGHTSSTT
jgi:hypothetical protein